MFRFGLSNLRRLANVPPIELRPITILVGRNSSGKSTFLRALPLLRQSITTRTSSPILWYGDWVDFGDFERAVFENITSGSISFEFGVDEIVADEFFEYSDDLSWSHVPRHRFNGVEVKVEISKHGGGTRISSLTLKEASNAVEYEVLVSEGGKVTNIRVNGADVTARLGDWELTVSSGSILPTVMATPKAGHSRRPALYRSQNRIAPANEAVVELVTPRLDKRITNLSRSNLISQLMRVEVFNKDTLTSLLTSTKNRSWQKLIRDISGEDRSGLFEKIRENFLLNLFPSMLGGASKAIQEIISSTLYIGPARANSDRYYRYQDLAVSEIDPAGKNFPMFLNSLRPAQMKELSDWVKGLFGYGISVGRVAGHVSINLIYESGSVNIVDTGYGISQILPVLGQIWWANNRPGAPSRQDGFRRTPIIAIEQPELHLHPAHQALLADAFVGSLKKPSGLSRRGSGIQFLIETHSEALINRLGALIAEKEISADDVQILIFDAADDRDRRTKVSTSNFDDDGQLVNWPYGFFVPS